MLVWQLTRIFVHQMLLGLASQKPICRSRPTRPLQSQTLSLRRLQLPNQWWPRRLQHFETWKISTCVSDVSSSYLVTHFVCFLSMYIWRKAIEHMVLYDN
ncbi:Germinal-center associated nuclear protein [Actinidia chinensis var. chinensis]|uniref:Germinal-center associated nuclear protein n=1 Tax=Actinidia chinensis var. chinensis TaxID=1590841 RepID=A0A2R6QI46_ACTCC|nr:Germinal-center associated nuclear protein [Actinidia chinensis var. chinensis]